MVRVPIAALFAVIVFSGWDTPANTSSNSFNTAEGTAHMLAASGITAQWATAQQICVEHGFPEGTSQFLICFTEYQMHSLRALGLHFRVITDTIARQHGLCIDRSRSEMVRCKEI